MNLKLLFIIHKFFKNRIPKTFLPRRTKDNPSKNKKNKKPQKSLGYKSISRVINGLQKFLSHLQKIPRPFYISLWTVSQSRTQKAKLYG